MSQSKAEAIVVQLLTNAAGLRYGAVSVTAKMHDGKMVSVSYTTTEQTREQQENLDDGRRNGNIFDSE